MLRIALHGKADNLPRPLIGMAVCCFIFKKGERGFQIQSQTDKREPDAGESGCAEEMNSTIP